MNLFSKLLKINKKQFFASLIFVLTTVILNNAAQGKGLDLIPNSLIVDAGNDTALVLPTNSLSLNGTATTSGSINSVQWSKINGAPVTFSNANALNTSVSGLDEGVFLFVLTVSDNLGETASDTIVVTVSSRILIDFGSQFTGSPDANGYHWNNVNAGTPGIKLFNAINVQNLVTNIGLEVVNRIDGTFNLAGPGVTTANSVGIVGDYPATATSDYAFSHSSTSNGKWKLTGLDSGTTYTVKFWGTRNGVSDSRFIEIKREEETTWKTYNARNNTNPNNGATFTFTGKTEQIFDIRSGATSTFGHICLIDIKKTVNPSTPNIPPIAFAGGDLQLILPGNTATLNGSRSSDPDGTIIQYQWRKIQGPATYTLGTPNAAITTVTNVVEGVYLFELSVTDNNGAIDRDTVTLQVGSRILIDFGDQQIASPEPTFNNYWNNVTTGTAGIKLNNSVTTGNISSGISFEIVNRLDGTFNPGGPGVNTGSNAGIVGDYPAAATSDYCFTHPSTTSGRWRFTGLDSTKTYSFKFWGSRSVPDPRITEIKPSHETTWQSYDASNNSNFDNAAYFTTTGRTEISFDIRTGSTSPFGYINIVDINYTNTCNETTSTTSDTACDTYTWNGNTYTSSGTYTFNTTNAAGCDSTATLILTINRSTGNTETQTACSSYTWNETTYTASGTYTFTSTNPSGCNNTDTLLLTINQPTASTDTVTVCDSYTWNGTTYTTCGTYTYTFTTTNAAGCDSVATLILTVNHSSSSSDTITTCSGIIWNGNSYSTSGVYTYNTTNSVGCDSTATLVLTVNEPTTSTETQTACDSYSWNGNTYTASGTYTFITTNANGCDSTATLILTINESTTSTETQTACDSYSWNGNTYTTSGTYTFNTTNANGCDSTATLILTVNESTTSTETQTACGSYSWNGNTYTTSGTYTFNTTNANGCDSTATLVVSIENALQVNAGGDQVIESDASATLAGSILGNASSFEWTGGNGTFNPGTSTLNTTYTPSADEISIGSVELYLTATGTCGIVNDTIVITITNPTPVTLLEFKGVNTTQGNRLNWSTSSEQNNTGFQIQRSIDGQRFVTIGYVKSAAMNGNSQQILAYQFMDVNPATGTNYYRLKQIDLDQKFSLSKVIALQVKPSALKLTVQVYPNPTTSNVNLAISSSSNGPIAVLITDAQGKLVHRFNRNLISGTQTIQWSVTNWASGLYHIRLIDQNGNQQSQSFIKK
jgi:hypothetical protein